jgi:hypothetical protein
MTNHIESRKVQAYSILITLSYDLIPGTQGLLLLTPWYNYLAAEAFTY